MSFLSTRPNIEQPEFLRHEEPLADYRFGGYHPTSIGDVFNDRYRICRKLGWGNYSTVWLARDTKTDEYCSIKVLTGMATFTPKLHELEFLQHTARYDPSHPGYSRVARLLDHFHLRGPYGKHLCLVIELLGESVQSLRRYTELQNIYTATVKRITRDVLRGLDYLHKSGIVHTDLKLDNFLIEIKDVNAFVRDALDSSSPKVYPEVQAADGRTINYVGSTPLAVPIEDIQTYKPLNVKITDLGVACWESKVTEHFTDEVQPPAIRAPEVYVGSGWDSKCDIWSLGLLVLEMLRGESVLPVLDQEEGSLEIQALCLLHMFGPFPPDLLERGKYSGRYFNPDGSFLYEEPPEISLIPKWTTLLDVYEEHLHPDELRNLRSFLEAMLKLRPEDRWTAAQLLQHEWINTETRFLKQ